MIEQHDNTLRPLSTDLVKQYRVIPLEMNNGVLHVGIADPTDQYTIDAIIFHTGLRLFPVIMPQDQLNELIEKYCNHGNTKNKLELSLLKEIALEEHPHTLQESAVNYNEPLIKFVDHVIQHAIKQSASDIHIEPSPEQCRIRYRRDGILYEIAVLPAESAMRFITRLKVMAKLDIAERRLPQDGRFRLHSIDIRISTCPTIYGEKIVLRLLDPNKLSLDIDALGLSDTQRKLFITKISEPHGLILVTGPTGCGKTVTLYSAIQYLNNIEKNISTVEDPVEMQITGINQVSIQPKIGLDFATVLRSLLRQDPDIIMVGEIRDQETAEIALHAANTGHLVLSTLHTNSAIETIARLTAMGMSKYTIASSVSLIIAQRLIRKLCNTCKQPDSSSSKILNMDINNIIYRAAGCKQCLHGYHGRTGIYEFIPITEQITELILSGEAPMKIKTMLQKMGYHLLYQAGIEKVMNGFTSMMEIQRVTNFSSLQ